MISAVKRGVYMGERKVSVEVVFAGAGQPILRRLVELANGSTLMQAVESSGIARMLPAGTIDRRRLGVFGRKAPADQLIQDGDRIEIYRPLLLDPMEARRRRAR